MKRIKLTKGKWALVDDSNYDWLNWWKWYARIDKKAFYACRKPRTNRGEITMHRVIMGNPKNVKIDHRNRDTLDNRQENLRICSDFQNAWNSKPKSGGKSNYKGVWFNKLRKKWCSMIMAEGKRIWLGSFSSEKDAALAYDIKARELHGGFAVFNFPPATVEEPKE